MADDDASRELRAGAEEVLAGILCRGGQDREAALEEACRAHPALEGELRRMHREWLEVAGVFERMRREPSSCGPPTSRTGPAGDAGAGEGRREPSDEPSTGSGLLRRLRTRAPASARYRIRGEVAAGGMGVILEAWDEDLRRTLAMKVIRGLPADRGETRAARDGARLTSRFLEEAQVTGQLEHPGIVPVHELGTDPRGQVYFTMPLVRGRDLKDIIRLVHRGDPEWSLPHALGVVLKVCEAMAYAHSKGVLHRDLKPANIRVGRFGETYVMDWGLARVQGREDAHDIRLRQDGAPPPSFVATDRSEGKQETPDSPLVTMDGDVVGTPSYMSPEQARGRVDELGPRSEVYAVGALLYHLLAGHPPYVERGARVSPRTVLAMLLQAPPRPLLEVAPDTPPGLAAICEKAMRRDPLERYADMLALARDVEAWLGRRRVTARPASIRYALRLAWQRHRAVFRTAAVAVAVLVLSTAAFLLHLAGVAASESSARQEAEDALADNERLLHVLSVRHLIGRADELLPALPRLVPELEEWLGRVDALLARRAHYEGLLRDGAASAELAGLVADLAHLSELRPRVASRLEVARGLPERSIERERLAWEEAIDYVAEEEVYGFELSEQLGLVPLGPDPDSGLYEFWHLLSGECPNFAEAGQGGYRLEEPSGIVLVLLPGGRFRMGSTAAEPGRVAANEAPREVVLEPFFIGKYEVTQGQWTRTSGQNPAFVRAGDRLNPRIAVLQPDQEITALHPVENVSWEHCAQFASRLDLELPTEAQWEYACRAGRGTAWHWGDDPAALRERENLVDQSARVLTFSELLAWNDGFAYHAPVGSFAANGFGLCDMHGNVAEWCSDWSERPPDPPDGRRRRNFRGGSWYQPPRYSRSAFRQAGVPRALNSARGLRVARRVIP